ncbi:hypothetical protein PILCRDRAFT_246542 [Piloderma croceum F 1598]|uniref:Uncharacterized protein n=1 Tax=Piloderma croceum (strain F 1598) TaxID=765440 RepID=A0A0C3GB76_PILCF|nr:hypothetical protein PILCRDRAFT_246542 [Piloderma croceum F 1598]
MPSSYFTYGAPCTARSCRSNIYAQLSRFRGQSDGNRIARSIISTSLILHCT